MKRGFTSSPATLLRGLPLPRTLAASTFVALALFVGGLGANPGGVGSVPSAHAAASHLARALLATTNPCNPSNQNCCQNNQGNQGNSCCQNNQGNQNNPNCCPKGYKCQQSSMIRTAGTFQIRLSGTNVRLVGYAKRSAIRSQAYLARVSIRTAPRQSVAFKVFATKLFPTLRLATKGRLYRYIPATGGWRSVPAITSTGIYAAVLH